MASIDNIRINGQATSASVTPVIAGLHPIITWDYDADIAAPHQNGYELRISTSNDNLGNDLFSGGVLTSTVTSTANNHEYTDHSLSRGVTYYGQIRILDTINDPLTIWNQLSFVVNRLPSITGHSLSPTEPTSSAVIELNYTYQDVDGHDQAGTKIRWFKNNLPQIAYDDLCSLPISATIPGDSWTAKIIPSDGLEFGAVVETAAITIVSTGAGVDSVTILPDNANVDDILQVDYSLTSDEYTTFTGDVIVEWYINDVLVPNSNQQFIRPILQVGDVVHVIVILSEGGIVTAQLVSDDITIEDVDWHITDLTINGLRKATNLVDLTPSFEWNIHKTTVAANIKPTYLRVLITKTPSLDGPIFDSEFTQYTKNSYVLQSGILERGNKYFLHIGIGDTLDIDEELYETREIQMSGSGWLESVNNTTGWTVELKAGILLNVNDVPMTEEQIDNLTYNPNIGLYIHDGTYFCVITLGLRDITFLSNTPLVYTYASNISSLQVTDASDGHTFKITGQNNNIQIFLNNQLVIDAQGLLTNPSLLKSIEYGDIDGKNKNIAIVRFFRYSTKGTFGAGSTLPDADTFFFTTVGEITNGSVEYIFDNFVAWTPDSGGSTRILNFSENVPTTKLPTVNRNYSPITVIRINEDRSKYIGTANGVTRIIGDKHDPDYEFITSDLNVVVSPGDFDRITSVSPNQIDSVESNERLGWFTINTSYRSLGEIVDQGVATGDEYDPYLPSIRSFAIHYYTQRTHGHAWYDNVDNEKGWQISFSFDLNTLESDDFDDQDLTKSGFGIYVNDGTRQEIIYFYEDRIRLFYANVYVPLVTTSSRDYVIIGKGDNINIYQKLTNSAISRFSKVVNGTGLFTNSAVKSGNSHRPQVTVDSSGVYHAVWHDDGNGRSQIMYSSFDGQNWSAPSIVTETTTFNIRNPSITVDSKDRLWVAYEDTSWGPTEISVSVKDTAGWNPKIRVTNALSVKGKPNIVADINDNVHVVWEDNRDGHYAIFWAEWDNIRQAWISSGQFGSDAPIMQQSSEPVDEYGVVTNILEFKNPKLATLGSFVYVVCEGHLTNDNTVAIYRGVRDLTDAFWNSSGAIIIDSEGDFTSIGAQLVVSDTTRYSINPSIAASALRGQYVVAWEDQTEPVSQIWGASFNSFSSTVKIAQSITNQPVDCKTPACGFVSSLCAIVYERNNGLFVAHYNTLGSVFSGSATGGTDENIDTGTYSVKNPAMPPILQSTTFIPLYDFNRVRTATSLSEIEFPDYQLIGSATAELNVGTFSSISFTMVSELDTKEFAFGDFSNNVGMIADWKDIRMYFGYDAIPQTITQYNTTSVIDWPDNRINDIFIDTFGNIVAATYGGLLYYNVFTAQLTQIEGHTASYDTAVGCSDVSGVDNGTCLLMKNGTGKLTTAIAWGGNGVWYVGTTDGVFFSQTAGKIWDKLDRTTFDGKIINSITVNSLGQAVIAAHDFDATTGTIFVGSPTVASIKINIGSIPKVVVVDENDIIWVGTNDGLYRIEDMRTILIFDSSTGMRSSHVNDIAIVSKHLRYVATASGVERMYGTKFTNFNVHTHSITNDNVSSVEWHDNTQSLWVASLYALHEIVFRDTAHDIIDNETVIYDNTEISTEQSYEMAIFSILDFDQIASDNITSESASVFINKNKVDFGYTVSDNSILFQTNMLVGDQIEVEISEQLTNFHDFTQKNIEKQVVGEKNTVISKIDKTSKNQFLFLSSGDKNEILLYGGESSLPFSTISLDTRPPIGCIEQLEILDRTKIRFRILASDDLSGVESYILSNYSNFTSDGTTPLDYNPIVSSVEHNLGEGLNNVLDSLTIPDTATIGTTTFNVGDGAVLGTWFDEDSNINYLFMATSNPVVIYRYNPVSDEWTAIQALDSENANRVSHDMLNVGGILFLTTGSDGVSATIFKCINGLADDPFEPITMSGANHARGITGATDGTVYFGSDIGKIFSYKNSQLTTAFSFIGDSVHSLASFSTTLVAGTGDNGRIYLINIETGDALIILDTSDTTMNVVNIKDPLLTSTPEEATLFVASSNSTIIYRSDLDSLDFIKSYSSFGADVTKIKDIESITYEQNQNNPVDGTTTTTSIGVNIFKHAVPAWEFVYKHSENVSDFIQYRTNNIEGMWVVSAGKVTKWTAALTEKTVYLRLKDKAGNISAAPDALTTCPDPDASPATTCCDAYSIKIQDLADFVHEGRIVDVDSVGNVTFTIESPNDRSFFSGNQIDQEVGIYESEVLNGSNDLVSWKSITWDAEEPTSTSVNVQIRSGVTQDDAQDVDWSANLVKNANGVVGIEHITDQYIQFRVTLISQIRDLSPSLSSVTLRNLTSQASHFFTTNFIMPSRLIKGLLTSNTFLPVSSDVVFGINTKNSTDFGDYQIIEPNRLFSTSQGQFGTNLRVGARLLSPGLPILNASNNPGDPYDESSFICTIIFDYQNLNATQNYHFRIRFYNDIFRTQLIHTFFSGNDQTGWSVDSGTANTFPSTGTPITQSETRSITFSPLDSIEQSQKWYITVEAKPTELESYETVVDNMSYICSSCNLETESGLTAKYYTNFASGLTALPVFENFSPSVVTNEINIDFEANSSDWVTTDTSVILPSINSNFAILFTGKINIPVAGNYTFGLNSDDGSQLIINGEQIIDNDAVQTMTKQTGIVELPAGLQDIEVQFFSTAVPHGLILTWVVPGQLETVVPASSLFHLVPSEYCELNVPKILNFMLEFELENGETIKMNLPAS